MPLFSFANRVQEGMDERLGLAMTTIINDAQPGPG